MKDESSTFLRNVASLTTANFLARIVGAAVSILVINHLGDARFGAFATAMAFATVFLIFAETGVGTRFLYDRSADRSKVNEHFGAALVLQVLPYSGAFVVTMLFAAFVFHYERLVVVIIAIVSAAAILRTFAEICERVINLNLQMHLTALLRAVRFMIIAAGGIIVIVADLGPVAWAVVTLVAMAVAAVTTFMVALRFARPKIVRSMLWPTLRVSYIFGIGAVFFAIYDKVDQVMLSQMLPEETAFATVGVYAAAYTLISFMYTVPGSFVASMEPLAYGARGDDARLAHLGNISTRAMGALALPFTVGTMALAGNIQRLLLPELPGAGAALVVLAGFALFRFLDFPGGIFMAAAGMQKRRALVQAAATVFNIGLNFIFIPIWGLLGAAAVTVATEALICTLYTVSLSKRLPGYTGPAGLIRPIAASAVMGAVVLAGLRFLPGAAAGRFLWLVLVPAGALVYFAALWALGFFQKEEAAVFKKIVSRLIPRRRADDEG